LPKSALEAVNWVPVSYMPSPESPAKRTTAERGFSRPGGLRAVAVSGDTGTPLVGRGRNSEL
jgi:hypothetical protein